jgi:hypothetical protein
VAGGDGDAGASADRVSVAGADVAEGAGCERQAAMLSSVAARATIAHELRSVPNLLLIAVLALPFRSTIASF